MYLHVGENTAISTEDIIAIINIKNCRSRINKDFLALNELTGGIEKFYSDEVKSCIITRNKILASSIASSTLQKRVRDLNKLY